MEPPTLTWGGAHSFINRSVWALLILKSVFLIISLFYSVRSSRFRCRAKMECMLTKIFEIQEVTEALFDVSSLIGRHELRGVFWVRYLTLLLPLVILSSCMGLQSFRWFLCFIVKYCGEGFYKTALTVDIPIQDKKRVYQRRSNFYLGYIHTGRTFKMNCTHRSKILRAVCDRISILFRRKAEI